MATLRHQISSLASMLCISGTYLYSVLNYYTMSHTVFTLQENLLYVLHLENEKLKKKSQQYLLQEPSSMIQFEHVSCLQYFELYSMSLVQCVSNLNKVLRNAATPAAVNYVFKSFMNLHFNTQMPIQFHKTFFILLKN